MKRTITRKPPVLVPRAAFIGIDNGVSGSVGIIDSAGRTKFFKTPTFSEQDYVKQKRNITRMNVVQMRIHITTFLGCPVDHKIHVMLEKPLTSNTRILPMLSAFRCLEATLISLEAINPAIAYIESREWQKVLLPKGTKGSKDLKKASADIGKRLFPEHTALIEKHKDADGILIAEYCRRMYR